MCNIFDISAQGFHKTTVPPACASCRRGASDREAGPRQQCDISIRSKRDITNQPLLCEQYNVCYVNL